MTIANGCFYLITVNEEFENLEFWRVDAHNETPEVTVLASDSVQRSRPRLRRLALLDSHRDNNEIVCFERPSA